MPIRPLLLLLLLAAPALSAPDGVAEFKRNFQPGMTEYTRASALDDLAAIADPDVLDTFDWVLTQTRQNVLGFLEERDDALVQLKRKEKQIDDLVLAETERARREGRAPKPLSVPVTLLASLEQLRGQVESLQSRVNAEHRLRDSASAAVAAWIEGLNAEDLADVLKTLERKKLEARDFLVRNYYVQALGHLDLPEAGRLLRLRLAEEDDRRVLPVVVDAVARQAGEGAVAELLTLFGDERWQVRAAVAAALGRIGSPEAIQPLIDRLREEDGRLRGDLGAALAVLTGEDLGADPDRWQTWWDAHRAGFIPPGHREDPEEPEEAGGGLGPPDPDPAEPKPDVPPPPAGGQDGPPSFYGIEVLSKRILFVIDISNSMNQQAGANRTKVEVAKYELKNAILGLPDEAAFNIVFYHHEVSVWRKGLIEARGKNRRAAVEFIEAMVADGNTNIYDALDKAFHIVGMGARDKNYELGADTIFFLSDGQPNRGKVTAPEQILAEVARWNELRRVKIHAVGVGPAHNASFMQRLAQSSGGTYVKR